MRSLVLSILVMASLSQVAGAQTVQIGPFNFDETAFADNIALEDGVLASGETIEIQFLDNRAFNMEGYDLVIFEGGSPEPIEVSLTEGGPSRTYTMDGGFSVHPFFQMNYALIDLSDFGVQEGTGIDRLFISDTAGFGNEPEITQVGARFIAPFNHVLLGMMACFGGIFLIRRKRA